MQNIKLKGKNIGLSPMSTGFLQNDQDLWFGILVSRIKDRKNQGTKIYDRKNSNKN